jgi:hypothetical protein
MVDSSSTPALSAEDKAFAERELLPTVEDLTRRFIDKATAVAVGQGWRPDHAEAAAAFGAATFLEQLSNGSDPQEAVDQGIALGKKRALGEMFETELDEGRDRHDAFRAVLDLQKEISTRLGEEVVDIPEEWSAEALKAVDAAAADGQPAEDQVMAGLIAVGACAAAAIEAAEASRQRSWSPGPQGSAATRKPT